jgi:hypothetical protein
MVSAEVWSRTVRDRSCGPTDGRTEDQTAGPVLAFCGTMDRTSAGLDHRNTNPTSMSRVTNASTVLSRHHVYTNANDGFSILAVYVLVIMLRKCSLYATVPCS